MNVSSRTPEGLPSRCPLCNADTAIEFSPTTRDAVCPNCGCLLWESAANLEGVRKRIAELLGVSPEEITTDLAFRELSFLKEIGAVSLDTVELVMQLEEEFDITLPDDAAEKIVTIGDLIRYLQGRGKSGPHEGPAA